MLHAALEVEMEGAFSHSEMLNALQTPSFATAVRYSRHVGNALSAFAAFSMPYRVDGTPIVTPTGLSMIEAENWPTEPQRIFAKHADDCDGSAQQNVSVVRLAVKLNMDPNVDMNHFPNLRAVAHTIGTFYIYGTSVLAANSGHAANVNEAATTVAGHAIMLAVPKPSLAVAMERGAGSKVSGASVVEPSFHAAVTAARFSALFPKSLVAQLPEDEQSAFASHDAMVKSAVANPVSGLQPLAMEGTTFASSTLYTHEREGRAERQAYFLQNKAISEEMAPNITRTFKSLDVGATGTHSFYSAFVELGMSLESPLFTDPALRKLGHATPHLRFAQPSESDVVSEAGASPKQLATGNYVVLPLWTADAHSGGLIDLAHAESMANTMPPRHEPIHLDDAAVADVQRSISVLTDLNTFLHAPNKTIAEGATTASTSHIVSFASLLHSEKAITGFCDLVKTNTNVHGEVYGLDNPVSGMAVAASDLSLQMGRFITIELEIPV